MSWSGRSWRRSSAIPASQSRTSPTTSCPRSRSWPSFRSPQDSKSTSTPPASSRGPASPHQLPASPPHSTSWLLRTSTFRAERTLRIHPACTLSSARRAAGERARRSGKPCRATWRPTNGWKSSTMRQTPTPKRAWSSEQRGSAPGPCGKTSPSRPCSAGYGRPAGPWRWPTATPRRSWAAGVSVRTT